MSRLYPAVQQNDLNSNFQTYVNKLCRQKPEKPKTTRDRSGRTQNPLQINRLLTQKNLVPYSKNDKVHVSDEELVHKEVINNKMAQVEVTVRTVSASNRSRTNSENIDKREPWAKLLQHKKSSEALSSHNYDYGLGTIHYLSKELQQKLESVCPGDSNVQQIVNDIQRTLYRINPSIVNDENVIFPKDQIGDINLHSKYMKENEKAKPVKTNKSMQTLNLGDTEKNMKQKLEYETNKYENTIRKLETTINNIKIEQKELEHKVQAEKEMVKKLTHEMNEKLREKDEKSSEVIQQLNREIDDLKKQLQDSKNINNQELNDTIQKLKTDNANIEYENMNLKHEQIVMKLEKEKIMFLLESRDKQIKSLKHEIDSIQSVVCSQIFDTKSNCFSPVPSRSSSDTKNWKSVSKAGMFKPIQELYMKDKKTDFSKSSFENPSDNNLFRRDTMKSDGPDEFPQRDVPTSNGANTRENTTGNPSTCTLISEFQDLIKEDLEDNIKEMFEKLKKQASISPDHLIESRSHDRQQI